MYPFVLAPKVEKAKNLTQHSYDKYIQQILERFVNLLLSIAVFPFIWIIEISVKVNVQFDVLRFIKYCDALNFGFFLKILSSNVPDILINTLDIVILADILWLVISYGGDKYFQWRQFFGDNSISIYYSWKIQMFLDMLQLLKGDIISVTKLWRFVLLKLVKDCCWL